MISPEDLFVECIARIEQEIKKISFSLERSASAAEATHKLYKKANEATERAMNAREEREREAAERAREDFKMAKERHELYIKTQRAQAETEAKWQQKIQDSNIPPKVEIIK